MAELDNRSPVEPRHVSFAQALVALCREHGVRHIHAEFYGGEAGERWTKVSLSWASGRHGDASMITMRAEAIYRCTEGEEEVR